MVNPEGVVTTFGLASANCAERKIGDAIIGADRHGAYLADKDFASVSWEKRWQDRYGTLVADTPNRNTKRARTAEACRWATGKRQVIEGAIDQLKDLFGLERHQAKTLVR